MSMHLAARRIALGLASMATSALGAACSDDSADNPCGRGGTFYEDESGAYCTYIVIEGGFQCPARFRFFTDFG